MTVARRWRTHTACPSLVDATSHFDSGIYPMYMYMHWCMYRIVPVSTHGCLEFTGLNPGVGTYMEKPFTRMREPYQTIDLKKLGAFRDVQ